MLIYLIITQKWVRTLWVISVLWSFSFNRKQVYIGIVFSGKTFFLHGCATCSELPSIISTMAWSIILMILKKRYSGHVLLGQRLLSSAIIYCQNFVSKNKSTFLLFYLCVCPKILVKFHVKLTIYKGGFLDMLHYGLSKKSWPIYNVSYYINLSMSYNMVEGGK